MFPIELKGHGNSSSLIFSHLACRGQFFRGLAVLRRGLGFAFKTRQGMKLKLFLLLVDFFSPSIDDINAARSGKLLFTSANTVKCEEKCRLGKNPSPIWDLNPRPSVIQMDALATELLETLWRARVNLWVSTGTASRGYTVK